MAVLILRRLRDLVIVLFLIGTALFFMLRMIPGSPAVAQLGEYATAEQIAQVEQEMGLDRPLFEQYMIWLARTLTGDLGDSFTQNGPVLDAILRTIGPTMVIAIAATVLSILISIPLAVLSVSRPDSWLSKLFIAIASFGLAVPGFWLALMLVLVFAVQIRIFPVSGYVSPLVDPIGALPYLVLPVLVILSAQVSLLVMTLREGMAGEMLNAYIRTARAKGVEERGVLYRHVLPNALLPAVTIIGSNFGTLLGGIVIIETVFRIPGVGSALYIAINARDYSLILGLTLATAVIIVIVNMIVDIVYGVLDPRVRVR